MKSAYWITPESTVIPVPITHIVCIINNPELFDIASEHIKALYNKYDEPLGFEGRARREIMTEVINKGYIRVRLKTKEWEWYMECREIDDNTISMVQKWINHIKSEHSHNPQYDMCKQIRIVSLTSQSVKKIIF